MLSNAMPSAFSKGKTSSPSSVNGDGAELQMRPLRAASAPAEGVSVPTEASNMAGDTIRHGMHGASKAKRPWEVTSDAATQILILERRLAISSTSQLRFRAKEMDKSGMQTFSTRYRVYEQHNSQERTGNELVLRNTDGVDLWKVRSGRSAREKYILNLNTKVYIRILVQTWLPHLPKRVISHSLDMSHRDKSRGIPLLLVQGDARSRKFSFQIAQNGQEIVRVKRSPRIQTIDSFAAETTEWEMRMEPGVDACLIVAFVCALDDFLQLDSVDPLITARPAAGPATVTSSTAVKSSAQMRSMRHKRTASDDNSSDTSFADSESGADTHSEKHVGKLHQRLHRLPCKGKFRMPRSHSVDLSRP